MEFLSKSLEDAVSKQSEKVKEEIDIVESIYGISFENREKIVNKIYSFLMKNGAKESINSICMWIEAAVMTKQRELELFTLSLIPLLGKIKDSTIQYQMLNEASKINQISKNIVNIYDKGSLERAIIEDDIETLKNYRDVLENETIHINIINMLFAKEEATKLELCAYFGAAKCFKYLLKTEEIKENACRYAVAGGNKEIINICKKKGLEFKNCINVAVAYHRHDLFQWLNEDHDEETVTLNNCIEYLNIPAFFFYLNKGADINKVQEDGSLPLHHAVHKGLCRLSEMLIESGNNVNAQDNNKRTPMHFAANNGYINEIELLESRDADIEPLDEFDESPLHYAAQQGHFECSLLLIQKGCKVNMRSKTGKTPLHCAVESGNIDTVKGIMARKAEINAQDNEKRTPLYYAIANNNKDIIKYLLKYGGEINSEEGKEKLAKIKELLNNEYSEEEDEEEEEEEEETNNDNDNLEEIIKNRIKEQNKNKIFAVARLILAILIAVIAALYKNK